MARMKCPPNGEPCCHAHLVDRMTCPPNGQDDVMTCPPDSEDDVPHHGFLLQLPVLHSYFRGRQTAGRQEYVFITADCTELSVQIVQSYLYRLYRIICRDCTDLSIQIVQIYLQRWYRLISTDCTDLYVQIVQAYLYRLYTLIFTDCTYWTDLSAQIVQTYQYRLYRIICTVLAKSCYCAKKDKCTDIDNIIKYNVFASTYYFQYQKGPVLSCCCYLSIYCQYNHPKHIKILRCEVCCSFSVCPAQGTPLDSETGETGDFWLKNYLLKQ